MKKRIMSLLLAVLMLVGTFPAPIYAEESATEESTLCSVCGSEVCTCEAEEASMDFSGDVLKYAEFIEASYSYSVTDGENLTADASVVLYYDEFEEGTIVRITDWYWDNETTALWYQVEFYSGGVVEEAAEFWPTDAWVLQDYTDEEYEFDCSLSFVAVCATCGLPDCDGEHTLCPTCGAVDCNGVHLICLACGDVACTEDHVWCGYCGEFDCGTEHESTAPITVPVMPESYTLPEGESMVLVDEHGDAIGGEGLCLTEGTKTSISAWSELDGSGASYRWQLCYDYENDLWVDIQGQTEKGMVVSAAMFRGIIDAVGTATLRCVAEAGEETVTGDAIPVYFAADGDEAALFSAGGASGTEGDSEITDEDVTIHKIIIEYVYADDSKFSGQRVALPYIAEIADGKELSDTVISPNCVGYTPDQAQVTLSYDNVTEDETITVYYSPAEVSYTVRHYLQNVDDDEYTWIDTTMATGKTEALTSDAAAKSYTGFTALTHFHEEIAADSSTMIDIYYDRNYYLMSFNLDGGYGVDPIYARYGADISVGTPYKAGYIFAGWDKTIPSTMPAADQSFTASWTKDPDGVSYTVAYWLEDANTSEYNFWGSFVVNGATADSTVQGETYKDYTAYLDSDTVSNMDTYEKRYSYYSHADTDVTVKGDGSTVVSVYYKRNEYTLKFYYAASSGSGTNANYYVIGGSTYYFGANAEISDSNKGNEIKLIDQYMSSRKSERGQVDELPALNAIGNARTEYTLGSDTSTVNGTAYNYHYLSFKAKYGEDISALWPCGVFNSVTRMNTDSDTNNSWSGVEAFVSAWNGEHHVLYSLDSTINKDNQTIKGNYSELDYKILWDYGTYGDPDDMTVSYLCFWENGADIGWSIPELYRYNIYVPVLTGQDTTGLTTTTYGGTTYYLWASYDTCDDSSVGKQTPPAINGYTYKVYTSEDLAPNRNESILYDTNGNQIYSEAYAVNFFYTRDTYKLSFVNGDIKEQETSVYFGEDISGMAPAVTYYDSAVAEMYVFSGWYTSKEALDDSKFELTGANMPASNLQLYAGWSLITHSVGAYLTAEDAENGDEPLFSNLEVTHNEIVPQEYHPDPSTLSHPTDESATFIGWFYKDANGNEQAFDFAASTVTEDLIIYAKWRSNIMKQVVINYVVEDADGNQTAIAATETVMLRVGQTRTFEAKTGVSLYEEYRTGCFPTTASHSITPTDTSTEDELSFTFVYKQYGKVPYQVEFYVVELDGTKRPAFKTDADGKAVFMDTYDSTATEYIEQHWQNDKAVVTELYVPDDLADITWKLPDAYLPSALREQKIIVPSTTNPETNIEANTIEFIYTLTKAVDPDDPDNPDSDDPTSGVYKSRYLVQHYIENAAYILADDKTGIEEYTVYSYSDEEGLSTQTATASPISIPGYAYSFDKTSEHKQDGTTLTKGTDGAADVMSGIITADDALELNFYYTVNSYPYQVMYLEEGSNRVLEPTKTTDSDGDKLTGYYSTKVTESAIEIEGYDVVGNSTASIYIQMEAGNTASVNTIVFYYALKNADLIISKTVALDEDQAKEEGVEELPESALTQEFEFTVYCPTGYNKSVYNYTLTTVTEDGEGNKTTTTTVDRVVTDNATTMTVKLRHGQTIQIHDLIMGTYIITETYVPGFRITVNGSSDAQQMENVSITAELVEANKDVQVDFTNSYPFFVGDLVLGKKVAKLDASDPDATEPYKVSVKFQPYSETREVDRVITFVDSSGNTVTDVDGNSSFTVPKLTGTDDETEFTIDVMVPVDGTVTMKGVPAGTFTATEEVKGTVGYIADFYTVTYNKTTHKNEAAEGTNHEVSGVVHGGHATELDFTNTYKKGNLTINKVVTQEYANDNWESDTFTFTITGATELPDGTYTVEGATVTVVNGVVTVKDEDGKDPAISITRTEGGDEWSGSLSFANLPAGYYTVTETAKLGNDMYTSSFTCEPGTGLVNDTVTPTVFTFNNKYNRQSADLKITATCGDASQTFMYVVTNVETGISLTVAVPAGKTVTIKDVPVGDYTVSEYSKGAWNWRYTDATAVVVEVRADGNNEAVFNYGAPTIVKWLNGYYYYKKEGGDG